MRASIAADGGTSAYVNLRCHSIARGLTGAQEMAAHESPRTTKLYDPRKEQLTQDEAERIRL
jgi:hypothetical protein